MKQYYLVICLFLIYSSCKFSPSDIPETFVEKPSGADAVILFELLPERDTIKLYEPTTLYYNINTLNKELYGVEYYLDDELLERQNYFNTEPYEFKFNTNNYNEGTYRFSIKVYTNTNTGSLADVVGAAGLMFELEWVLIIDKTEPRELSFISIDSVENGVKLVWEKFEHASFENYQIKRYSSSSHSEIVFSTDNPNINWCIDTNYTHGHIVEYEIKLNGNWGDTREYFQIPPIPEISYLSSFEVQVSWEKVRNPIALDFYYLYTRQNSSSVNENEKIYDADVTSKTVAVPFGKEMYYGIMYAPIGAYFYHNILRGEIYYALGEAIPPHDYMQRVAGTPYILLNNNDKIYKYNMETDEFIDSINATYDISWTYILSWNSNYIGYSENNEFYLRSTNDFSIVEKLSSPVYDGNSTNLVTYAISNNKRLLTVYNDKSLKLFDLEAGIEIAKYQTDATNSIFATLSSDGKYIVAKEYSEPVTLMYYELIGSEIVQIKKEVIQDYDYADLRYAFGENDEVYILYQGKLEIRNKSDFSVNRVISLPDGYLFRTSHEHMITIIRDKTISEKAYLVNMLDGQILHEIVLDRSSYVSLYGNYLTSGIGRKLNLDNL